MLKNNFNISSCKVSVPLTLFQTVDSTPRINIKFEAQKEDLNTEPVVLPKGYFDEIPLNYHTVFWT